MRLVSKTTRGTGIVLTVLAAALTYSSIRHQHYWYIAISVCLTLAATRMVTNTIVLSTRGIRWRNEYRNGFIALDDIVGFESTRFSVKVVTKSRRRLRLQAFGPTEYDVNQVANRLTDGLCRVRSAT